MTTRALMLLVALAFLVGGTSADAQVWKRIKEQTKEKVDKRVEKAEENVVTRTGQVVDSTVEKTGRGVDTAVAKISTGLDTVLNKTERGMASAFKGSDDEAAKVAADLADGRAVAAGISFERNTETLESSSAAAIRRLAKAIAGLEGPFLVEGHVVASQDPSADQTLSASRAAAVKARLIAEGVPATRLFSMGFGGMRPPAAAGGSTAPNADRIEIARMQ